MDARVSQVRVGESSDSEAQQTLRLTESDREAAAADQPTLQAPITQT
jgi:hypothetical protein